MCVGRRTPAAKVGHAAKGKRDRYSYEDLKPGLQELYALPEPIEAHVRPGSDEHAGKDRLQSANRFLGAAEIL